MVSTWDAQLVDLVKKIHFEKTIAPRNLWDFLGYSGTVGAALFITQFCTGLMLLFHYSPDETRAFSSTIALKNNWPFGTLFSNMHAIGAKLVVCIIFIHMFRILYFSAYRGHKSNQWFSGMIMLTIILAFGFTGYILPWSQQSYWASIIGIEAFKTVPVIGDLLSWALTAGQGSSVVILFRIYFIHCIILPVAAAYILFLHIKQVRLTRITAPPEMYASVDLDRCLGCGLCSEGCTFEAIILRGAGDEKRPEIKTKWCNGCRACMENCPQGCIELVSDKGKLLREPSFPHGAVHRASAILAAYLLFFTCVYFLYPFILSDKAPADPLQTPGNLKPDWYFLAPYQVLILMPSKRLGLMILSALYMLLFSWPLIDRRGQRNPDNRIFFVPAVKTGIVAFMVFTFWGWLS